MHCTGQTSTQARSFTSMQDSVMMAIPAIARLLLEELARDGSALNRAGSAAANRQSAAELRQEDETTFSSEQGERVHRRSGGADERDRGEDQGELVGAQLVARRGERFEVAVVE